MTIRNRITSGLLLALTLALASSGARAESPEVFARHWREANLDERIDKNIEKYRKGDAEITVVDAAGKPVPGAKVEARQTGHEFLFGCNAFVLGQLKTPEMNKRYEEAFTHLFNFATIPFYWEGTEPTRGELRYEEAGSRDIWRRPPPERFIPFAKKYGITLKGHPLLWHLYNPDWLPKDPDELRALYQKRFKEIASRFGDKVAVFDVVNEALACPASYPLYSPDKAYVAWAFNQAVPLFPDQCVMMINEYKEFGTAQKSPYFDQVKALLAQGVKIKGVGFQAHIRHDPVLFLDLMDKFCEFGLPLYITEITMPSGGKDGEKLQAEVARAYYRLWFSVPKMAGITYWNLGDALSLVEDTGYHQGLMDNDLNPKPAYKALDRLINHEWMTDIALTTDAQGQARFRGFHGKYQVTVKRGERTQTFHVDLSAKGPGTYRLILK